MIYITGDTHGHIDFDKLKVYFSKRYATRKDYLIILGDCGMIWGENEQNIHDYEWLGPTVLFIDGNHENFDLLNKFPTVEYNGAKCHRISRRIYHILRGEIITLNGSSFLCLGGATSTDKHHRKYRVSWWEEENITDKDLINAINNLKKVDYTVNYVLTHCGPSKIINEMFSYPSDQNTMKLDKLLSYVQFDKWFFGHYHYDKSLDNYRCFYNDILEMSIMNNGSRKIDYKLLTLEDGDKYLQNRLTGRKTKITVEDLPEWYFESYSYRYCFYNLKDITDIAFTGSPFDNHISKDSSIYLHYHGKLGKDENEGPVNSEEWDSHTWRCNIVYFILAIEKYSPHIKTDKVKAQINLVFDQYNGGNMYITNDRVEIRPFPEIKTPRYVTKYDKEEAQYEVTQGNKILSQFVSLERAKDYAKTYVIGNLGIKVYRTIFGNEEVDYIEAYDTSHDLNEWVYLKKIV